MFRSLSRFAAVALMSFVASIAVVSPSVVRAEEAPLPAAAQAKIDAFLTQLKAGKVKEAYDEAFAGSLMSKKIAEVEQAVAGTENGLRYYGGVRDWQLIERQHPADGFPVAIYLVRLESGPLFFRIQLYDNGVRWTVYNINFTDNYDQAKAW
jgi:hypothetical protein